MHIKLRLPTLLAISLFSSVITASADRDDRDCRDSDRLRFKPLPLPAGASFLQATAANSDGTITGYYGSSSGQVKGFVLDDNRFKDASLPSTTTLAIDSSFPVGITRRGLVAGMAFEAAGPAHAYTRLGRNVSELEYPGSLPSSTSIRSVSSDGKILGDATISVEPFYISFIYKDGVYTPLSLPVNPPAPDIFWSSINMKGHLLGVGNGVSGRVYVVAKGNHYKVLPALPGNYEANPVALLDSGDVVLDAADLDGFIDADLGYSYVGLVLRDGQWTKVRAPQDTVGITHFSGAAQVGSDDILLLGTYWSVAESRFKPFTASDKKRRDD